MAFRIAQNANQTRSDNGHTLPLASHHNHSHPTTLKSLSLYVFQGTALYSERSPFQLLKGQNPCFGLVLVHKNELKICWPMYHAATITLTWVKICRCACGQPHNDLYVGSDALNACFARLLLNWSRPSHLDEPRPRVSRLYHKQQH
jgi:hypothetical protein